MEIMRRLTDEQLDYNLHRRSPAELRKDMVTAFDRLHELRLKLWMALLVIAVQGCVIKWLATQLMSLLRFH